MIAHGELDLICFACAGCKRCVCLMRVNFFLTAGYLRDVLPDVPVQGAGGPGACHLLINSDNGYNNKYLYGRYALEQCRMQEVL